MNTFVKKNIWQCVGRVGYGLEDSGPSTSDSGPRYGFKAGKSDRTQKRVIDPRLQSTFPGGSGDDSAHFIAIGVDGTVYGAGATWLGTPKFNKNL